MNGETPLYESSWQTMMRKSLLATVSEKNPLALSNGPLSQDNPAGVTRLAKHIIDLQTSSVLSVADDIWIAILEIQDLMAIRNSINENHMHTEEEANKLLKATNSVQNLIEHISEQEDKYIQLTESINNNTIHLVQSYLKLVQKSGVIIEDIIEQVSKEAGINFAKQSEGVENMILHATSFNELQQFSINNTLQIHTQQEPTQLAAKSLDFKRYDDFLCMQSYILLCYRFAMSRAIGTNKQTTFDTYGLLKKIVQQKDKATTLLNVEDQEKTFALENFSKQQTTCQQLKLALDVNPDYIAKLTKTLNELKDLSDSRKDDNSEQAA
jgi:hypothetical protein